MIGAQYCESQSRQVQTIASMDAQISSQKCCFLGLGPLVVLVWTKSHQTLGSRHQPLTEDPFSNTVPIASGAGINATNCVPFNFIFGRLSRKSSFPVLFCHVVILRRSLSLIVTLFLVFHFRPRNCQSDTDIHALRSQSKHHCEYTALLHSTQAPQ